MISLFYKDKNPSQGVKTVTAHAQLDPALLFYINTLGCRCRAALATFADPSAYALEGRALGCCDNSLYEQEPQKAPRCALNGVSASLSVRYVKPISPGQSGLPRGTAGQKPSKAQITSVRQAIDSWMGQHWPQTYQMILPAVQKELIIANCMAIHSVDDLSAVLPKYSIPHSALGPKAQELVECIGEAVRKASNQLWSEPSPPVAIRSNETVRASSSMTQWIDDGATWPITRESFPPRNAEPPIVYSFVNYDAASLAASLNL
jgi:hypothetical protein